MLHQRWPTTCKVSHVLFGKDGCDEKEDLLVGTVIGVMGLVVAGANGNAPGSIIDMFVDMKPPIGCCERWCCYCCCFIRRIRPKYFIFM
jgi:hypothetical protein